MPRQLYIPRSPAVWRHLLEQTGSGGNYYSGEHQRGSGFGSFFRGLFRMVRPVLGKAAKAVGKQALTSGLDLVGDLARGKELLPALEERGKQALSTLTDRASKHLREQQEGSGFGVHPMASVRRLIRRRAAAGGSKTKRRRRAQVGAGRRRKKRCCKRGGKRRRRAGGRRVVRRRRRDIFG